jgi:hypothetical protein
MESCNVPGCSNYIGRFHKQVCVYHKEKREIEGLKMGEIKRKWAIAKHDVRTAKLIYRLT